MKTTSWICDTCGEEISHVDHGWVEWLTKRDKDGNSTGRGLRLVHHHPYSPRKGEYRCQYNEKTEHQKDGYTLSDVHLRDFMGSGGLMDLLSMLSDNELPKDEVIEMIKRLHIPGYEHARKHFNAAIAEGVFEPNTKPGFYNMSDIEATLKWLETE